MKSLLNIKSNTYQLLVGIALLIATSLNAQTNLVPNPSFEQYTNCPINNSVWASKNNKPDYWYKPDLQNAIYYNVCANNQPLDGIPYNKFGGISYQYPKSGVGYFAMLYAQLNSNNYIQVELLDSLLNGKKYYAEYYVSLSNTSNLGCNNVGMLFSNNPVYADTVSYTCFLQANPQILNYGNTEIIDTMGWVKVSGIFKAQGGEQYLTLGNFVLWANTKRKIIQNSANTFAAYYIDDVSVIPLDSFNLKADAGMDTTIHIGDSVFIGTYTNGIDTLKWQTQNTGIAIDSTRPGFWVHPTAYTCYVLTQTVNGYTSSDTVCITVNPLPLKFINYEVSLRGTKQSVVNNWTTANEINVSHFNIQRSINGKDFTTIAQQQAQNKSLNNYTYNDETTRNEQQETWFYRIQSIDKDGKTNYSTIQQINTKHQTANIVVFPNPAKDYVTIKCKTAKQIQITDCLGRVMIQLNNPTENQIINTKQFTKGLYIIQCTTNTGETNTQKLIINN